MKDHFLFKQARAFLWMADFTCCGVVQYHSARLLPHCSGTPRKKMLFMFQDAVFSCHFV
jgi:hypothetical protein